MASTFGGGFDIHLEGKAATGGIAQWIDRYYQYGATWEYLLTDRAATLWIPGDGGYIANLGGIPRDQLQGENVIYLGGEFEDTGCFETSPCSFAANAWFYGHGAGKLTFIQMFNLVGSWNNNAGAAVHPKREYLQYGKQ